MRLWDVAAAKELQSFRGHESDVLCVAFSPDGRHVLSAGGSQGKADQPASAAEKAPPSDCSLRLWDLSTGKEVHCLKGHTGLVSGVAFFPDGRRILSGSFDRTLRLWDVESAREVLRFGPHKGGVTGVAVFADGRQALSVGFDRTVRLWKMPE
jgi:WD40 repeat protein